MIIQRWKRRWKQVKTSHLPSSSPHNPIVFQAPWQRPPIFARKTVCHKVCYVSRKKINGICLWYVARAMIIACWVAGNPQGFSTVSGLIIEPKSQSGLMLSVSKLRQKAWVQRPQNHQRWRFYRWSTAMAAECLAPPQRRTWRTTFRSNLGTTTVDSASKSSKMMFLLYPKYLWFIDWLNILKHN